MGKYLQAIGFAALWACAGCAHAGGSAPTVDELATNGEGGEAPGEVETERLESQNVSLREQIRALEGQLAVARADLRRMRMDQDAPATTRISECATTSASVETPVDEAPVIERVQPSAEEPRIVLRLYGTPADRGGSRSSGTETASSSSSSRGPLPALEIPARPANVPGELSVTAAPRRNAPPRVEIPVAPPTLATSRPAARSAVTTGAAPAEDPAVRDYREALALVRDRNLTEGLTRLRRFTQVYSRHAYADNALFWQGEVLFMQRRYQQAIQTYGEVVSRYPRGNKVSDALLKMARCHQRLGNSSQASAILQRLQRDFPQSVAARIASREERS